MTSHPHPLLQGPFQPGWSIATVDQIKAPERHSCVAGPFGSSISAKFFVDRGVPIIRGSNLSSGLDRFVSDEFAYISEETASKFSAQTVRSGDLVFTCWGTIGQVGLIPEGGPFEHYVISNKQLKLRVDRSVIDPLYAYYFFASPESVQYIRDRAIGSAVPGINLGILKSLPVLVPPLEDQRRIIAILGAYDDLIEVNRRRVAMLEEMARGLFEEWFVRFRFPGHERVAIEETLEAALPRGWELAVLGDLVHLEYGKALKADARLPGGVAVYGSGGHVGQHNVALVRGPGIIVGRKGNVGAVIWSKGDFWPIDTVYYVKSDYPLGFLFHLLQRQPFQNTDAAVPGLNRTGALKIPVVKPPLGLCQDYERLVRPKLDCRDKLLEANTVLAASRDLLLPRLISGQLSVEAAERELEDVA